MRALSWTIRLMAMAVMMSVLVVMAPSSPTTAQTTEVWYAEYFDNMHLLGDPIYTESIPGPYLNLYWTWWEGPGHGVPYDEFSARYTIRHTFPGGNVKFMLRSDDGSALYLNGDVIINQWKDRSATWYEARVLPIPAGTYTIMVKYYDHFGENSIEATFEPTTDLPSAEDANYVPPGAPPPSPTPVPPPDEPDDGDGGDDGGDDGDEGGGDTGGTPAEPPPGGILVDDGSTGFTWAGSQDWGFGFGGLINNLYLWTDNSEFQMKMWGRWNVSIPRQGYWDVYVYFPFNSLATTNARYRVTHAGVLSPVISVSQYANGGKWVWLGSFWFNVGGMQYVYLNDLTFEQGGSRYVLYDAAKFVFNHD